VPVRGGCRIHAGIVAAGSGDSIRLSREFPECQSRFPVDALALVTTTAIASSSVHGQVEQGAGPLTGNPQVLLNRPQGFVGRVAAWAPES
jgi:hypothetical protein